jgi:membrane protein
MTGPLAKFFRDRGPHVAAMIAYFALLSLLPLIFLALALFGLAGRADEGSYLVTELRSVFPSRSIDQIVRAVRAIQDNAATLGLLGGALLLWSSLSLFSVLESAFNIVYGRPNRGFLHGKAVAFVLLAGSLLMLFAGLVLGTVGFRLLTRYAGDVVGNRFVAYTLSVVASSAALLVFLLAIYVLLTNLKLRVRDVLPGALMATLLLQITFQALPVYLWLTRDVIALQTFGGLPILLIWLYVMANVIVLGAEVNWWLTHGRPGSAARPVEEPAEEAPGLA